MTPKEIADELEPYLAPEAVYREWATHCASLYKMRVILEALRAFEVQHSAYVPDAISAIREHNEGCDAACMARRPSESTSGCGYQEKDGALRYKPRRCPECPLDWKIDFDTRGISNSSISSDKK